MSGEICPIERHLSFPAGILRMRMLLTGLETEVKFPGMRMTRKADKCSTIIRREFGLVGRPPKLLEQFREVFARADAERTRRREVELEVGTIYFDEHRGVLRHKHSDIEASQILCLMKLAEGGNGFGYRLLKENPWAWAQDLNEVIENIQDDVQHLLYA